VHASCGFAFATVTAAELLPATQTIIVAAGLDCFFYREPEVFAWLRRRARHGNLIGGISGGPVVLARAGLLQGRRCTVHWEAAQELGEAYPDLTITDAPYEIDGGILTCAGGTAALDLMLHLIESEHGRALAGAVSDQFLHAQIRTERDHQRTALPARIGVDEPHLLAAIKLMESQLSEPLSVGEIATRVGLARRQLERLFRRYLLASPHEYYMNLRLMKARVLVDQSSLPLIDIAILTGFSSPSHFSKCYREHFGHQPTADRQPGAWPRGSRVKARLR